MGITLLSFGILLLYRVKSFLMSLNLKDYMLGIDLCAYKACEFK